MKWVLVVGDEKSPCGSQVRLRCLFYCCFEVEPLRHMRG